MVFSFRHGMALIVLVLCTIQIGAWSLLAIEYPPEIAQPRASYSSGAISRDQYVEELRKIIVSRPNDPRNLLVEMEMGASLSQQTDPKHNQGTKIEEGFKIFEHIVKTYKHMDYYHFENSPNSADLELCVPRAAILAGDCCHIVSQDSKTSKEYYLFAMECLKDTYERRLQDWKNEPAPQISSSDLNPERVYQFKKSEWEARQAAIKKGDIFGENSQEAVTSSTAVRQYLLAFGRLLPEDVPAIMGLIILRFPNTPMAHSAQKYIDKAIKMKGEKDTNEIITELLDLPVANATNTTANVVPSRH